mgnify:CR=1 FL=1
MNIYAMKGHKVKCETLEAGYDHHKREAERTTTHNVLRLCCRAGFLKTNLST